MKIKIAIFFSLFISIHLSAQFTISGQILTDRDDFMNGVTVFLMDGNGQPIDTTTSNGNGIYGFSDVAGGANYLVQAELTDNPLNGLSTFDMVLMIRHILGSGSLSPAQVVAADINGSGSLTTLDVVMLRTLILSISQANLVPTPRWLFYTESNGTPQFGPISILNLNNNVIADIKGIKRGDVNGSAVVPN